MLTELMAGGDLWKMIGNGPTYLPEAKSQKIAKKILESVAIMHAQGIIHRDLKPGVRISLPTCSCTLSLTGIG